MGMGLKVACPCFGDFTMMVGAGIASPGSSLFPFLCTACEAVSVLPVEADAHACAHCGSAAVIPYGTPPALGEAGPTTVFAVAPTAEFSAQSLTITDGTYWCPTCRQHTTRFSDAGLLWD